MSIQIKGSTEQEGKKTDDSEAKEKENVKLEDEGFREYRRKEWEKYKRK